MPLCVIEYKMKHFSRLRKSFMVKCFSKTFTTGDFVSDWVT